MNRLSLTVLSTFALILLISGGLVYVLRDRANIDTAATTADAGVGAQPKSSPGETPKSSPEAGNRKGGSLFGDLFGENSPDVAPAHSGNKAPSMACRSMKMGLP